MTRGPVIKRVINMPMRVEVQQESENEWVALMPAYVMQQVLVTAQTEGDALRELKHKMRKMWGKT